MISLPWPDKGLSPNARLHRQQVARIRKRVRGDCAMIARGAKMNFAHMAEKGLHVRLTFHPPDARRRDLDNLLASCKSHLDGVADAIGVDDHKWDLTLVRGAPKRPFGEVRFEVIQPLREAVLMGDSIDASP